MNHCAGGESIFRKLPQLLHADGIDLRIFSGVEIEKSGELLCQCAARTLGENRNFRAHVDSRLVIRFALPILVDAFVADAYSDDASVFDQHARRCKFGKHIDAGLHDDRREPANKLTD